MNHLKLYAAILSGAAFSVSPTLAQEAKQLEEVTVIASRTTSNAEGYTTNLRGTNVAKGKPAADVLGFLPNISREEGNFKINGLAVSDVYVDGVKLSDLSELSNIPGEIIDKVTVKYLAGSDNSAALSGGSIMITLRRPPESGYYGTVKATADWHRSCDFGNEGIGGLIYYRYKNLSIYDNLYAGATKLKEESEQWFETPDMGTIIKETTKSHGFDFRNRLSISQQFKSGTQLGGSYLIATSRPRPSSVAAGDNAVTSIDKRHNTLIQEGTVKLTLPLNQRGASMDVTADYYNRHSDDDAAYFYNDENIGIQTDRDNLNQWKIKADFLYPRSRSLSWKFGASAQWIASEYTPVSVMESDRFQLSDIPTKTTGFTPIVYAAAQGRVWKLRYSAGVNWQLNRIGYTDRHVNQTSHNTQWAINPTVQLMMPFGAKKDHALMLSYKHTLSDIPYTAISSVVDWTDSYNYTVGNPDLKAQSADMVMAGVSLLRNKLNITAVYARTHDRIYWQTFQDATDPEVVYTKPINISGQDLWGIGAEWMESPAKWWRFKLSGRVEITPENITIGSVHYDKTRFKEYFYFNNSFSFHNGWGGMLNVTFEPTYRNLDRTYHAVYDVSGRISKSLLRNKLQIAVDFTALGNRRKLDRMAGTQKVTYKYTSPVQYIGVSVAWNFSGGKKVDVNVVDGIQDYHETKDNR